VSNLAYGDDYIRHREILGEAICLRVTGRCAATDKRHHGPKLGIDEARRIINANYPKAKGKTFREIVTNENFSYVGYDQMCKIARTLGIDPDIEIARHVISTKGHLLSTTAMPRRVDADGDRDRAYRTQMLEPAKPLPKPQRHLLPSTDCFTKLTKSRPFADALLERELCE